MKKDENSPVSAKLYNDALSLIMEQVYATEEPVTISNFALASRSCNAFFKGKAEPGSLKSRLIEFNENKNREICEFLGRLDYDLDESLCSLVEHCCSKGFSYIFLIVEILNLFAVKKAHLQNPIISERDWYLENRAVQKAMANFSRNGPNKIMREDPDEEIRRADIIIDKLLSLLPLECKERWVEYNKSEECLSIFENMFAISMLRIKLNMNDNNMKLINDYEKSYHEFVIGHSDNAIEKFKEISRQLSILYSEAKQVSSPKLS